jgi:hypothetical protein
LIEILETLRGRIKKLEGDVEKEVLSGSSPESASDVIKIDSSTAEQNTNSTSYAESMKKAIEKQKLQANAKPKGIIAGIVSAIKGLFVGEDNE